MKTLTIEPTKSTGIQLEVDYIYFHDPGVHTEPNGDPGYPPCTDIEIIKVVVIGDAMSIFQDYNWEELEKELLEKIEEHEDQH